jgi:hypothetical protein
MTFDFKFLNTAKDHDPSEIKGIKHDELLTTLNKWLISWCDASYIDDEAITYVGILIAKAGYKGVEKKLYHQFSETNSELGFEITNNFLTGYWCFAPQADSTTINYLQSELQKTSIDSEVCASAVLALNSLITSKEIKLEKDMDDAIRKLLLQYYNNFVQEGLHSNVTAYLEYLYGKSTTKVKPRNLEHM